MPFFEFAFLDPTQYSIIQDVIQEGSSATVFSAVYKFAYPSVPVAEPHMVNPPSPASTRDDESVDDLLDISSSVEALDSLLSLAVDLSLAQTPAAFEIPVLKCESPDIFLPFGLSTSPSPRYLAEDTWAMMATQTAQLADDLNFSTGRRYDSPVNAFSPEDLSSLHLSLANCYTLDDCVRLPLASLHPEVWRAHVVLPVAAMTSPGGEITHMSREKRPSACAANYL